MKPLSLKQYIKDTIKNEAEIGYGRDVKQWYGILHHLTGSIYSQRKTKTAVEKEMAEVLEEFITMYLEDLAKEKGKKKIVEKVNEITTPKIQRAYL